MKKIKLIILVFICFLASLNAQETVWGTYKMEAVKGEKKMKITFSYFNDFFYMEPIDNGVIIGNEHYKAAFEAKEGKAYLTEVLAGKEYMHQGNINLFMRSGFNFTDDQNGLNTLMDKFTRLTYEIYRPGEDFSSGWVNDEKTHINYMELYGKGGAYFGSHNLDGEKDGFGSLIFANKQVHTGTFKEGKRNGEFIVKTDFGYDFKGEYVNDKEVGTWLAKKTKGADMNTVSEGEFVDGKFTITRQLSKKQDVNLKTSMEKDIIYKSHWMEEWKEGKWKREYMKERPREYFEIKDIANKQTYVKYFQTNHKKTEILKQKSFKMHLFKIEEDNEKKVEYYSYTFKEGIGHSVSTITYYKERKEIEEAFMVDYNIVFEFTNENGSFKYYLLWDEKEKEDIEAAKEYDRLLKEGIKKIDEIQEKLKEEK